MLYTGQSLRKIQKYSTTRCRVVTTDHINCFRNMRTYGQPRCASRALIYRSVQHYQQHVFLMTALHHRRPHAALAICSAVLLYNCRGLINPSSHDVVNLSIGPLRFPSCWGPHSLLLPMPLGSSVEGGGTNLSRDRSSILEHVDLPSAA